ncbi:ankyrin repeat domain-containing protein, partial [Enterococcus sp. 2CBP]|uniref:ankyrin repeat domain-containing protein n=1 Tax=Enterococcus sp. 2CBP TaxID=2800793 RepID=UPI0028FD913B
RPSEERLADLNLQLQSFFGLYNSNWENWRQLYEASPDADSDILDTEKDTPGHSSTLDPDSRAQSMLGRRFYYAALFGLEEILRYLYSVGKVDINDSGGHFGNPLLGAIGNGNLDVVKFLLEAGADVNPPSVG